ncbi:MAG: signal recognition particle receptor subunit alpha, partial [Planctomycetota bacterium]
MGLFDKFKKGLNKTANLLKTDIRDLFKSEGRLIDEDFLEEIRGILFRTDMGYDSTEALVEEIGAKLRGRVVQLEEVVEVLKANSIGAAGWCISSLSFA